MTCIGNRVVTAVSLALLIAFSAPNAAYPLEDHTDVEWAYGTIVDSITVTGNENTKGYVVLREMETQVGEVLERHILKRDLRFLSDLSPFATVDVQADSLAPGHCALRIHVTERSSLLIKSIVPIIEYDFEKGFEYGVRWTDKNFRGRLERLDFRYKRNQLEDDELRFSWNAPWIGWRHIAVGGGVSYFKRGELTNRTLVLESTSYSAFVALPLTKSRIAFSQIQTSLAVSRARKGGVGIETIRDVTISPLVGYLFNSRDSSLKPSRGQSFFLGVRGNFPVDDGSDPYYWVGNDVRSFVSLSDKMVVALLSNFQYQFGDFPDFSTIRLGGPGTLRAYPDGRFSGFHRWFQTIELRYQAIPKKVFYAPFVKNFDIGVSLVGFIDSGLVWKDSADFEPERLHGTAGFGVRLYSPIQDVVRFDFGFSAAGEARFYLRTGPRF